MTRWLVQAIFRYWKVDTIGADNGVLLHAVPRSVFATIAPLPDHERNAVLSNRLFDKTYNLIKTIGIKELR